VKVTLSKIKIDANTQSRVKINQEMIDEYAEAIEEGEKFPPITLFNDGISFYLADGFHRFFAHQKLGLIDIESDILRGTARDARLYSFGANANHGLRRSIEDKRKAVMEMLDDFEWSEWSDREIAKHCSVTHPFVAKMRQRIAEPAQPETSKASPSKKPTESKAVVEKPAQAEEQDAPEAQQQIDVLLEENDRLTKQLAIQNMPEAEQAQASTLIDELREELRVLQVELNAVIKSRDLFQAENGQLKKQIATQQKYIKKLEAQHVGKSA